MKKKIPEQIEFVCDLCERSVTSNSSDVYKVINNIDITSGNGRSASPRYEVCDKCLESIKLAILEIMEKR